MDIQIGNVIQAKDWDNEKIQLKVTGWFSSNLFGPSFHGLEINDSHYVRYRSLPISRIVYNAFISNCGFRKWKIIYPDGTEEMTSGKAIAKEIIMRSDYAFGGII